MACGEAGAEQLAAWAGPPLPSLAAWGRNGLPACPAALRQGGSMQMEQGTEP